MRIEKINETKVSFVYANGRKRVFSTKGAGTTVWEHLSDGCVDGVITRDNETLSFNGVDFLEFMCKNQRRILRTTWK
jgi:hypothetical protein